MTKEELIKYIEGQENILSILREFAKGKPIQYLGSTGWIDIDPNQTDFTIAAVVANDIRIKPEPHYRPFKERDEFFAAAQKHGFWMQTKQKPQYESDIAYNLPICVNRFGISSISSDGVEEDFDYREVLDIFVWKDDTTPCGVLTDDRE